MNVSENITEGIVKNVSDVKEYKPGKTMLSFRLITDDQYPVMLEFSLFGDRITKHKGKIKEGGRLKVQFNIKSNEYNGRLYFSLSPWSIESLSIVEDEPAVEQDTEVVDPDLDEDVPF